MFAFKTPGGRQPLSLAVTETRERKEGRERGGRRGEAGKEHHCVAILLQISDWLIAVVAVHVKKWAFTWVYNRDYITYTVASLYPRRLPSAPRWFTHS